MGALSRAVALRFEPDSTVDAGSNIYLVVNPTARATATTVLGTELTEANASATGLGAGMVLTCGQRPRWGRSLSYRAQTARDQGHSRARLRDRANTSADSGGTGAEGVNPEGDFV